MGLGEFFGWGGGSVPSDELPLIFPMPLAKDSFIEIDVINIYQKILTDVMERVHGLDDEKTEILWDNCIQSEANHGLISLLARAMAFRKELFLVYDAALNLLRLADPVEQQTIKTDYAKTGGSDLGIYVSFQHYLKSDLVRLYSALEYCTIASLNKSLNLSTAIQLKMSDMRQSTGLSDSQKVIEQAQKIAKALGNGRDVLMDAKDIIENALPDLTSVNASIEYLSEKRAFYLGMPASYLCGEQTTGISSTGEADTKAVERGLKNYYFSIMKPVLEALFQDDVSLSYKSQDFRQIDQAMNALKVFSVTDDTLLSVENKTLILNKLLDLPEDEVGDEPEPKETLTPEQIGQNNVIPVV
jgi:hypothetical protein